MDTTSAASNDTTTAYERYANIFSLARNDTKSISAALRVVDAYRVREQCPPQVDLAAQLLAIVASLFSMTVETLRKPGRHRDKTSARYVAAWLLSRQHWTSGRIADELNLESSTIRHGLARVETTDHLRAAACRAELLLLGLG